MKGGQRREGKEVEIGGVRRPSGKKQGQGRERGKGRTGSTVGERGEVKARMTRIIKPGEIQ